MESVGHGAFYGWNSLIFAQAEFGKTITRIIECGGGEAKLFTNVKKLEYRDFSMAIISSKSNPGSFTNVESSILNKNQIPYYTDQVLSTYLLSTDTQDAMKKSWHIQYRLFKQQSNLDYIDTTKLCIDIKEELVKLKKQGISQNKFALKVCGRAGSTFSDLIKDPKMYDHLSEKGKESFKKMKLYLDMPPDKQMKMLE
uniref:CUT domain-containing protein n=1 Tax=Panagrolaimus davidi TaxID=227884 RepID=A0A914P923_9BILA